MIDHLVDWSFDWKLFVYLIKSNQLIDWSFDWLTLTASKNLEIYPKKLPSNGLLQVFPQVFPPHFLAGISAWMFCGKTNRSDFLQTFLAEQTRPHWGKGRRFHELLLFDSALHNMFCDFVFRIRMLVLLSAFLEFVLITFDSIFPLAIVLPVLHNFL